MDNPNSVPWPVGFVVKKGSKARLITSAGMPVPVLVALTDTYWPGSSPSP